LYQRGVMLLEALVAILIFSIGILGVVGLQATAVKQSTDARYRAEAALLADQLLGQMWISDRTTGTLQTQFNSCSTSTCAGYQAWRANVAATLPGVAANPPIVDVSVNGTVSIVTISVFWRPPTEAGDTSAHRYDVAAQISQ
jgi:type IV pilus assembly protein PilV